MNKFQWKIKRAAIGFLSLFVLYFLLKFNNYHYYDFVILPKTKPTEPWEFIADFSNMKMLNPTIIDFNIISESGTYEHWKYTTEYTENLSHWPYLRNKAVGKFDIRGSSKKDTYYINSVHKTCFIFGLVCLESTSEFKFSISNSSNGALCEENINYQCPIILSIFCEREVRYQRTEIMKNLKKHFGIKKNIL